MSEILCLKNNEITFLLRQISILCGVEYKDIIRAIDLMLMSGLSDTLDQLAMASSVHSHGMCRGWRVVAS